MHMHSYATRRLGVQSMWGAAMAFALSGCLVSGTPVLDASNGSARPIKDGGYIGCELSGGVRDESDCTTFNVSRDYSGLYTFAAEGEQTLRMRFQRIARGAYAGQATDGEAYGYFYVAGNSRRFTLVLMKCDVLPAMLRGQLLNAGDLQSDSNDYNICTVVTPKGLKAAANAYHRGQAVGGDMTEFRPVSAK